MSWTIERQGRVAVVMTNPVNAQNRAFFADLHEAIDVLERDHAESPVVLTGAGTRLSAGLDLGEHLPLFAGDRAAPRPASRRRSSRGGVVRRAADLRVRLDDS
jgi:enoyl-CoA hydratase